MGDMNVRGPKFVKILVPVLIIAAIAGIYLLKNAKGDTSAGSGEEYGTEEFALDATGALDMERLLSYGLPVVIDFGADSCVPCKQMAPVLEELNEELRGKAIVKFVDVWEDAEAGKQVPLRVIPTQFFFRADGTPYVPEDEETAAMEGFILYSHKDNGNHVLTAHEGGMTKDAILAVLKEMGME